MEEDYKLYLKIAGIMVLLTLASIVMYIIIGESNFSTNLFSEFVSIIITVVIINWIFERHRAKQWEGTEFRITKRIEKLIISYANILRRSLKIPPISDHEGLKKNERHIKIYQDSLEGLKQIKEKLNHDPKPEIDWKTVLKEIGEFEIQLDHIMRSYESKLDSIQHEPLMDIEENLVDLQRDLKAYNEGIQIFDQGMLKEIDVIIEKLFELDKTRKFPLK